MSDRLAATRTADDDRYELVDIDVPLPEIWTFNDLGSDNRSATEAELAELLADKVDDPDAVAASSMDEFLDRVGGGGTPLLIASFREEMDDESILSASLVVAKNDVGGSLDPWRQAYADAVDVTVLGEPALRTYERTMVRAGDLFDDDLTVVTWRYLVPFDARSILMFSFSSPNAELDGELLEHFDDIMADVEFSAP